MATDDPDICAYAIHTGKPRLAVSTCQINVVQDNVWAKAVAPSTWLVFSRDQTTLDVTCAGSTTHDRTRRPRIRGVGLLRLPAACRATLAGWELISSTSDMLGSNTAVDSLPLAGLEKANTEARDLANQAASALDNNMGQTGTFDLDAAVADILSARAAQAAPYKDPVHPSYEI